MFQIGSNIRVRGYSETHTITGIVDGYGYITSYNAEYNGRTVLIENLYVPFNFALAI